MCLRERKSVAYNDISYPFSSRFIRRSNMARVTTRAPYKVRYWKQLVSEGGTREQMCLKHVFER